MADELLLTTPQASIRLGATESAIRTAKSRNKDRLLEGTHWIADSGRTLWTGTGVEVLQELLTCNATVTATEALPTSHTTVTADPLNPIGQFADAIAWEVIASIGVVGALLVGGIYYAVGYTAGERSNARVLVCQNSSEQFLFWSSNTSTCK